MEIILLFAITKYLSNSNDNRDMKTFNTKLIVALFTTLVLTGCMPDSLTKFKKDAPKKAATTATDDTNPPITDGNGNAVDPDTLIFPTKFYFGHEGVPAEDAFQVNTAVSRTPQTDGTLADPATRNIIFIRCELDTSGAVITRTLPPGLALNQSTCSITGTPTTIYSDTTLGNVGGKIAYTVRMLYKGANYTGVGTESSLSATISFAIYDVPGALDMTQNDKLQVKLTVNNGALVSNIQTNTDSLVSYNRYGVLNTNKNVAGIVKYVDSASSTVGIYRVQPLVVGSTIPFAVNGFVSTAGNVKRGKILSVNSTTKTIYVEALTANTTFAVGDALDNASSFLAADSTVTAVTTAYKFSVGAKVDNDSQYFTEKFNVEKVIQTYERGVTIQPISPILTTTILPANGVFYGISPALPDGLSFDETTGVISGVFNNTLDATSFTITAYNDLGESNYVVYLAAINSPKDLSYTSNQLISVNSNTLFLEGESLFQPIAAPLTTSVQGKILRKVSTNKLSIENLNGSFLSEASLDSGNAYYSEKNYVTLASAPNHFNVALKVTSAASFPAGTYLGASNGAKGRVIYSDIVNNVLYVQFLTPTVVSSTPAGASVFSFTEGTTLDDAYPWVAPIDTITQVEASNMALTLNDSTGFDSGNDFTTNTSLSGYIYDLDSSTDIIKVNEINRTSAVGSNYFRVGQSLDQGEYYSAPATTISAVTHDNLIVIERGVSRVLNANVSQGTSIIYSISPALPSGLSLNALTGVISGTPTTMSARKSYVVTATNLLDKSFYTFDLEVRDYFTFTEASGAKSFLTHKVGDSRSNRACRINAADILNGTSAGLDIGCNLEAEELELFYTKLKMTASIGGGACEYIGFRPYAFWQYAPIKSAKTVHYDSGCASGVPGAISASPTSADLCDGNYTNAGGPNCDEGVLNVTVHTRTAAAGACDTTATQTIACAGVKTACLAGPVTTVMSSAELSSGYRSQTVASSSGATKTWELKSSVEYLDITNLRNANGVVNNACSDTRADANTWAADQASRLSTVSPFGGGESPFYEFTCLDAAKDIKARIRLTVREWNRTFRINDIYDLVVGPPITPSKMNDISAPVFGTSYNNVLDWDDDYTAIGTAATMPACGRTAGTCSDVTKLTEATCIAVPATWTPTPAKLYQFPGSDI
jgi:hypothetical protein